MSSQKKDEKIFWHPVSIFGTIIMVSVLVAIPVLAFVVVKPTYLRMEAAGTLTFWHRLFFEKALWIILFVIAYFGYILQQLPREGWNWKKAVQAGVGAVIAGILMGLAISMAGR